MRRDVAAPGSVRQGCGDFSEMGCFVAHKSALPRRKYDTARWAGSREGLAMTQGPNRVLDDFAKLMTDMAGVAQGARREVETAFRAQAERFLADMDLVKREEHDVVKDMAARALDRIDELEARIVELEKSAAKPRATKAKAAED
ncbi:accessory factor UbiK family protein [Stappia indica]|uniref:accessory factor UbiK family protein n=2 Tax=Stappia indica TaxID=538381 RepID=UPI0031345C7F